ncbi:MAG: MBL fold metallo-hydrolase [Williamsia sp.]|nr:MBL fold metallo-hydrolase [Williamsia sp.]
MKIAFHGAARTVTGSKHLITLKTGNQYLLDCGMFQGMGPQTDELNSEWGFDPALVKCLLLSHAHIDHSGLIPKLVKDGFTGPIYCTPATRELVCILLEDSAEIQKMDSNRSNGKGSSHDHHTSSLQLYTPEDVRVAMTHFKEVEYDTWVDLDDQVQLMYSDTGHLIGSGAINLKISEDGEIKTLTFSGDVGRFRSVLLRPPTAFPQADCIIVESTYGDSLHDISAAMPDKLLHHIENTCLQKKGKLIIPAFSIGRTQELLFALNQLEIEKRLPELSYFVDSPLSIKATETVKKYAPYFKDSVQKIMEMDSDPFAFKGLKYIQTADESIALTESSEPCVIIAASGMAEAGRVRHHIKSCIESISNTILIVGYCEPKSLGGELAGGARGVYITGDSYDVHADVVVLPGLSAHGDYNDLLHFLSCQDAEQVKQLVLVHGEHAIQEKFEQRLHTKGFTRVQIPAQHAEIEL